MPKTGPSTAQSAFHTNFIDVHHTIKLTSGHTGVRPASTSEGLLEESYRAQRYQWLVCVHLKQQRCIETHLLETSFATVRGQESSYIHTKQRQQTKREMEVQRQETKREIEVQRQQTKREIGSTKTTNKKREGSTKPTNKKREGSTKTLNQKREGSTAGRRPSLQTEQIQRKKKSEN